jgi:hypothetical protein
MRVVITDIEKLGMGKLTCKSFHNFSIVKAFELGFLNLISNNTYK